MKPEVQYYVVGILPVKYIRDIEKKIFEVKKYDDKTGCFVNGNEYFGDISHSTSDVEEVSKDDFILQLEKLRARHINAEGELSVLYDEIREIVEAQRVSRRWKLTPEERQHLAELAQISYQLFESTIGRTVCGHSEEYD
jgi:hypothetical protein